MDIDIFTAKNPWRSGVIPQPPGIRRSLLDPVLASLENPAVDVVLGARATGKTTLLLHVIREAVVTRLALPEDIYYFDLDTMDCADLLGSNRALLSFIGSSPEGKSRKKLVVIDEAQRLPNPGLFLKSVHDLHLPIKLLVTGSSSLELRSRIRESLAGRRATFFLRTLSPGEWLAFSRLEGAQAMEHYMRWGGYPGIAIQPDPAKKGALLVELLDAYLYRDIEDFLRVERLDAFKSMVRILARQAGQLVNLNEIAGTLGISHDTARRYLSYFQETFIVQTVAPFFRNLRSELSKMPKVFFTDLGLRNLLAGELQSRQISSGPTAENFVFVSLLSLTQPESIKFWRTEGKAEVDFVVETPNGILPIEVKSRTLGRPTVPTGLRSFIKAYGPKAALVLNENLSAAVTINTTEVLFVSRDRWLEALATHLTAPA